MPWPDALAPAPAGAGRPPPLPCPVPDEARPAFAAFDLGTNNCRLLIGTPTRNGFRVVDGVSRIVRLGEGLQATGRLGEAGMLRAIEGLRACLPRLARHPVRATRAVATEACRQAENGRAFLQRVEAETGLAFEVISPREEASLALEGCAPLLRGAGRRALLFDIGGGSTELAWVRLDTPGGRPELIGYDSLPIGVMTMAERHGPAAFHPAGFAAMVEEARARLLPFEQVHRIAQERRQGGAVGVGTSGTATTLAGVALNLVRYRRPLVDGVTLEAEAAGRAVDALCGLGRAGLAAHPCVGPERADYVLPGCAIFAAIQQLWQLPQMVVADRGLREGMLLRLMRDTPRGRQAGRTPAPSRREPPHRPPPV